MSATYNGSLKFVTQPVVTLNKPTQTEDKYLGKVSVAVGDDTSTLNETFQEVMIIEEPKSDVNKLTVRPILNPNMLGILQYVDWPEPEMLNFHNWTQEECQKLKELAGLKRYKDWDTVAWVLNTGRTGYQCYVYLRTQAFRREEAVSKWTSGETATLQSVVDLFKKDKHVPWGRVANSMLTRTKLQCYVKYNMMCEADRKGKYLDEEDCAILSFVSRFGPRFRELSWIMVGRTAVQLSARYRFLTKLEELSTWSIEDDIKLNYIRGSWPLAAGQTFEHVMDTAIEQNIKCFPGRDVESIRERLTLLGVLKTGMSNEELSYAVRREWWENIKPKSGNICFGQALKELNSKLVFELQSYQEAVWKKKGNKKFDGVQNADRCPLAT